MTTAVVAAALALYLLPPPLNPNTDAAVRAALQASGVRTETTRSVKTIAGLNTTDKREKRRRAAAAAAAAAAAEEEEEASSSSTKPAPGRAAGAEASPEAASATNSGYRAATAAIPSQNGRTREGEAATMPKAR